MTDRATPDVLTGDDVAGRVVGGGTIRLVGFVASNLVAVGSSVVLLRHLGVEDFGRYGTVMALMTIINGLTDGGMNIAGTRELSLLPVGAQRRALTGVILGIRLLLTVVGIAVAVVFAVLAGYDETMVAGAAIAGAGLLGLAAVSALTLPLNVELRNLRLVLVEVAKQVIQFAGTIAFALAGAGLLAFFGVQAIVGFGLLLVLPLIAGLHSIVAPRYDRAEWLQMIRVALPIALAGVLAILYLRILVVLGSLVLDDRELGLFVTSARSIEVLSGLPLLIVSVALPVVSVAARDNPGRLLYVAQRLLEASLAIGIGIALMLSFGARPAVLVLGGSDFTDAAPVLATQAWMLATVFVIQSCVMLLVAMHRQADIVRANLIGLTAVLVAGGILLPTAGAQGGAVAALIADVLLVLTMLTFVRQTEMGRQLTLGTAPRIALAGIAGVAAGLIPGLPDLVASLLSGLVFVAALFALRAVPSEAVDMVRSFTGRANAPR
jgi:O-antigen/teichoic acid export membrane protein